MTNPFSYWLFKHVHWISCTLIKDKRRNQLKFYVFKQKYDENASFYCYGIMTEFLDSIMIFTRDILKGGIK